MFYVPTTSVEDWRKLLADPEKHWKDNYSAKELAVCWQKNKRKFPVKVQTVLVSKFRAIKLLIGIPEHKVSLKGGGKPSQNDIWVLAKETDKLISIAVEGKVHEDFDQPLSKWYHRDSSTEGRKTRFDYLCDQLGITGKCSIEDDTLKYQLFHRAASAVIEAERFCAKHAVMLVHTFYTDGKLSHFEDYQNFVELFGLLRNEIKEDSIVTVPEPVGKNKDIQLHFAWVKGS